MPSTGAAAWMRAARLTVDPTATKAPSPRPSVLTTTSPVSMPTRIRRVRSYDAASLGVEPGQVVEHGEGGADGTLGVVLVGAAQPEDGHHRVADELLDLTAVLLDDAAPPGEVGVDDRAGVLGVEVVGEEGEAHQVGEEDGDEPALLHLARHQGLTTLAHGGQGDVDDVVAEHGALLLERLDRTVQRDQVVGGCRGVHRR